MSLCPPTKKPHAIPTKSPHTTPTRNPHIAPTRNPHTIPTTNPHKSKYYSCPAKPKPNLQYRLSGENHLSVLVKSLSVCLSNKSFKVQFSAALSVKAVHQRIIYNSTLNMTVSPCQQKYNPKIKSNFSPWIILSISGSQFDSNFKTSNDENIKSAAEYISGRYWQ